MSNERQTGMKLVIEVDIDTKSSGLNPDEIKGDVRGFTLDLLRIGAEEQGIGLTLEKAKCSD